jgi:hypothetical protein
MAATPAELTVKARLTNFGNGVLRFTCDAIKFEVETGRFRKHRKVIREIPLVDVESVERQGNDLSIAWKGVIEMFIVDRESQVEPIYERITTALKEGKKDAEKKESVDEKQIELAHLTWKSVETADSMFDILRNLHGRVDWNVVENIFKKAEENVKNLASHANSACLDVRQLSAAVQERRPKEIAEKTHDALRALYDHFDGLSSSVENGEQFHPNRRDLRLIIRASYILNDILLGTVVGDDEVGKEGVELLRVLEDLSKLPGLKVDVKEVKAKLDKICAEKETQNLILSETRSVLGQQLKKMLVSVADI